MISGGKSITHIMDESLGKFIDKQIELNEEKSLLLKDS